MRTAIIVLAMWNFLPGSMHAQTLDSLVQKALESHLSLDALTESRLATESTEKLQDVWAPPVFTAGIGLRPVETRVGPQRLRLGVQQRIPYSGAQQARREVVQARRYGIEIEEEQTKIQLRYQVQKNYYALHVIHEKEELINRMLESLNEQKNDRIRQMEIGEGKYSQVLLIRRLMRRYEEEVNQLGYQRHIALRELSYWVGVDSLPDFEPETEFPPIIALEDLPVELLSENHPYLQSYDAMTRQFAAEKEVARMDNYPQFTIGVDYIINSPRRDVEIADNGKNAVMPMIGVQMPFLTSRYDLRRQELERNISATQLRREDEYNRLNSVVRSAMDELLQSKSRYRNIQQQIADTEDLLQMIELEIASNTATFYEYWQLQEDIINFKWAQLDVAQKAQEAWYFIQKYKNP